MRQGSQVRQKAWGAAPCHSTFLCVSSELDAYNQPASEDRATCSIPPSAHQVAGTGCLSSRMWASSRTTREGKADGWVQEAGMRPLHTGWWAGGRAGGQAGGRLIHWQRRVTERKLWAQTCPALQQHQEYTVVSVIWDGVDNGRAGTGRHWRGEGKRTHAALLTPHPTHPVATQKERAHESNLN